jgi:hypothetical protein
MNEEVPVLESLKLAVSADVYTVTVLFPAKNGLAAVLTAPCEKHKNGITKKGTEIANALFIMRFCFLNITITK